MYRHLVIAILFATATAASFGYLLHETFQAVEAYRSTRTSIADVEALSLRADALQARYRKVEPKEGKISGAFLSLEDLPRFFELIELTAAAAGVQETISIESEQKTELTLRVRAEGSFPGLFVFIKHLNVLPTLLFVEEVRFNSVEAGTREGEQPLLSAEVRIRVPLRGEGQLELKEPLPEKEKTVPASDSEEDIL